MRGRINASGLSRAFLRQIRCQAAVLCGLLVIAGVLSTTPVAAADPPADYRAAFDACPDMPSWGFVDVPDNHPNAEDIDCLAYYGITKGTSEDRFSPRMSVSRRQMALFLTRLARLVGIEMASDPPDPGFVDIGDLPDEVRTAVAQLADLGITRGTSATAFSPSAQVRRGHMALFVQRLMNRMDPMADGATRYGFIPSDVTQNLDVPSARRPEAPFADLGSATKNEFDAITQLWQLGVARGISATTYAPGSAITRAAMAEMIAAVLDHSNLRPAGLTIQASRGSDLGGAVPVVAVSFRDARFAPIRNMPIRMLDTATIDEMSGSDTCRNPHHASWTDHDCGWYAQDERTDRSGNCFVEGWAADGESNTYVAWIAGESGLDSDIGSDEATVTVSSRAEATGIRVTSNTSGQAVRTDTTNDSDNEDDEPRVSLDQTPSVTFTAQVVNDRGKPVAIAGVKITVGVEQRRYTPGQSRPGSIIYGAASEEVLTTNDAGRVSFTVFRPTSTRGADNDRGRADIVTFSGAVSRLRSASDVEATGKVIWTDAAPMFTSGEGAVSSLYALVVNGKIPVRATAHLYDQYGYSIGRGYTVRIGIDGTEQSRQRMNGRGVAGYRRSVSARAGSPVTVTFSDIRDDQGVRVIPSELPRLTVMPVVPANNGSSRSSSDVGALYQEERRFHIAGTLYSYDPEDTFIHNGEVIDIEAFETKLGAGLDLTGDRAQAAQVEVVLYDSDGPSIFRVNRAAEGEPND